MKLFYHSFAVAIRSCVSDRYSGCDNVFLGMELITLLCVLQSKKVINQCPTKVIHGIISYVILNSM